MTNIIYLHKVTSSNNEFINSVNTLYHRAFPKEERRPWEALIALIDCGSPFFSLYVATNERHEFAGFVTLWRLPKAYYIEHLAVSEDLRSGGVGSTILTQVKAIAESTPIVVEVELPDSNGDANRRISFYNRNGFIGLPDFTYFQPPYALGLPDVQLMLMSTGEINDLTEFVIMLHTLVYNQ